MVKDLKFLDANPALLIDGSNLLIRLLYSRQSGSNLLSEPELITSVANIFIHQLKLAVKQFNASSCYIVFDIGGSYRKTKLFPEYKRNRDLAPVSNTTLDTKDYLFSMYGKLRDMTVELCRAFNLPVFMETGIEADDILGIMAEHLTSLGKQAVIFSNDSDFLQLVSNPYISCYIPTKKQIVNNTTFTDYFEENKGIRIHPSEYLFFKALVGDKGDNIPGIPRVGYKTLYKLKDAYFASDVSYLDLYDKNPVDFITTVAKIPSENKLLNLISSNEKIILRNYKLIDLSSAYASAYVQNAALKFLSSDTLPKPNYAEVATRYKEIFKTTPKFDFILESITGLSKCFMPNR